MLIYAKKIIHNRLCEWLFCVYLSYRKLFNGFIVIYSLINI